MENFFMGIVSVYFAIKTIYFFVSKLNKVEKYIADGDWDWISGRKD
tara:strand:+ start:753 stop:890 length:138 start_codon:yes stop_codon:yes gene_type:complete